MSKQPARLKWEPSEEGNYYLEGDGFALSYRPSQQGNSLLQAYNTIGGLLGLETSNQETALILTDGRKPKWRILKGDFRAAYEAAFPLGLDACVAIYEANKAEHRSDWSTD